jgi:hypothetical protein
VVSLESTRAAYVIGVPYVHPNRLTYLQSATSDNTYSAALLETA